MKHVFLGIDFGTTNCSAAYVCDDPRHAGSQIIPVQTVQFDHDSQAGVRSARVPTILSQDFDDRRRRGVLLGWQFFKQLFLPKRRTPLLRHGHSLFRSVKSDLGSFKVYPRSFRDEYNTPESVAAAILSSVVNETRRALPGFDFARAKTILTVPASLNSAGRDATRDAAQRAGLAPENLELLDEPVAALLDLLNDPRSASLLDTKEERIIAVFDYGGGTLDVSLVAAKFDRSSTTGLRVENLAISSYRRLGGDCIDREIMNEAVWPQIEAEASCDRSTISVDIRQQVEDTFIPTVARGLKERMCLMLQPNSRPASSKVEFPLRGRIFEVDQIGRMPSRFDLSVDTFTAVMSPFLRASDDDDDDSSLLTPLCEVLEKADFEPEELNYLVLHGGASRNPLLRSFLFSEAFRQRFSTVQVVETPDLDASVAKGAALACYWKHARTHELVAPIIPQEVGILTLSEQPVPIIKCGEPLPYPDEESVYEVPTTFAVPKDRQRELLVPFYAGTPDRISGCVKLTLPPNTAQNAPVKVKLRIDRDKRLHWWYSVGGGPDLEAPSLNNPWTDEIPNGPMRRLLEHRRFIRSRVDAGEKVRLEWELQESYLLFKANEMDELEVLASDLMEATNDHRVISSLMNDRGIVCARRGHKGLALGWYERAIERDPSNACALGNAGGLLLSLGRVDEAISRLRSAIASDHSLTFAYESLGDAYRARNDEPAALREYMECARLARIETASHPEDVTAWLRLARVLRKLGDYDGSHETQRQALVVLKDERFLGDHTDVIAGPDSGFLAESE